MSLLQRYGFDKSRKESIVLTNPTPEESKRTINQQFTLSLIGRIAGFILILAGIGFLIMGLIDPGESSFEWGIIKINQNKTLIGSTITFFGVVLLGSTRYKVTIRH